VISFEPLIAGSAEDIQRFEYIAMKDSPMSAAAPEPEMACPPKAVLTAFGLAQAEVIGAGGGTAARKWVLMSGGERFVLRIRPEEFASEEATGFDHAALLRLAATGLPVPRPLGTQGAPTWVRHADEVYEALTWVDGKPFDEDDLEAHRGLGEFLARFHRALAEDVPAGKAGRLREDYPDAMEAYLAAMRALARGEGEKRGLDRVDEQLRIVRRELDDGLYELLPRAVIHGDVHPGNLRFCEGRVTAVYDFDYLGLQARARDVSDAILFFASRHRRPLDPDDIRSLTQPVIPDSRRTAAVLAGYESLSPLTPLERTALPLLMRSRWVQVRLRGCRKVPESERVEFALAGFDEVIDWLNREATRFLDQVFHGS
jgi:homoserine kinase type II